MKGTSLKSITANIIQEPFLRFILCFSIIIFLVFPIYGTLVTIPAYYDQQIENIENEASRTANHLSNMYLAKENLVKGLSSTEETDFIMQEVKKDFSLEKIKIFNRNGNVIYSTSSSDIGKLNTNDYFLNIIAKGTIFSKIVKKNTPSLEGRLIDVDVAEIYVPIMDNGYFVGAFEIYYDITSQKQKIDNILLKISLLASITWLCLLASVIVMLFKASRSNIKRSDAEQDLKETNQNLERTVAKKTHEINVTQKISIEALAILAEHYDKNTGDHLNRIQRYVRVLLEHLAAKSVYSNYLAGKSTFIEEVTLASLLHDVGKTAVSNDVLRKPGTLTEEEFEHIKTHTVVAGETLALANKTFKDNFKKDSYLALAKDIAMHHHEKWNGTGYPSGLKGEEIPLSARVVAIADVYDALRSERPYKNPWSHKDSLKEISNEKGEHFDPILVEAFLACAEQFEQISNSFSD